MAKFTPNLELAWTTPIQRANGKSFVGGGGAANAAGELVVTGFAFLAGTGTPTAAATSKYGTGGALESTTEYHIGSHTSANVTAWTADGAVVWKVNPTGAVQ